MDSPRARPSARGRWSLLVVVCAVLAVGAYWSLRPPVPPTPSLIPLRIGVVDSLLITPIVLADDAGYFRDQGLDVELVSYASGKDALGGVASGSVHLAAATGTPVVLGTFGGRDFCVFASFAVSYDDTEILVRKDGPIDAGADLRGRRVATDLGTGAHFFLATFLLHMGLTTDHVELMDAAPERLGEMLLAGQVDAVAVWQPHGLRLALDYPDSVRVLSQRDIVRNSFNLVGHRALADKQPQVIAEVLRALQRAADAAQDDPRSAKELMSAYLELDSRLVEALWERYRFDVFLDQALLVALEDQARWMLEEQLVSGSRVPNFLEVICPEPLTDVDPQAVTIIR